MERVSLSTFKKWEIDRKASYVMGLIMDPEVYEVSVTVDGDDWYITSNNAFCMFDVGNYTIPEFVAYTIGHCKSISIRSITTYDYLRCERADLISKIALGKIRNVSWEDKSVGIKYEFSYLDGEWWEDMSDHAEAQSTVTTRYVIGRLYSLPEQVRVRSEEVKE